MLVILYVCACIASLKHRDQLTTVMHIILTAMTPADLSKQLESAFEQAHQLLMANKKASTPFVRVPNVTVSTLSDACMIYWIQNINVFACQVFLDELNASTCGGLFKEIIIDRTFEGEVKAENVLFKSTISFIHIKFISFFLANPRERIYHSSM